MAKFQVKITSPGTNIVPLVKTLRLVADLGLGDAKHLSDFLRESAPCLLVAGVDREVADHAAGLLREAGAEVVVRDQYSNYPCGAGGVAKGAAGSGPSSPDRLVTYVTDSSRRQYGAVGAVPVEHRPEDGADARGRRPPGAAARGGLLADLPRMNAPWDRGCN